AVQLLLKRSHPDALIMPLDTEAERKFAGSVHKHLSDQQEQAPLWIGLHRAAEGEAAGDWTPPIPCDTVLHRPCDADEVLAELDRLFNNTTSTSNAHESADEAVAVVTAS